MANPLSPNVTRAVVREWLQSKADVLDEILTAVVNKVAPIAEEHAGVMVVASIDPDPREALIDSLEQVLCDALRCFTDVGAIGDDELAWSKFWEWHARLTPRLEEAWAHLAERRMRLRGCGAVIDGPPAAEGGGA